MVDQNQLHGRRLFLKPVKSQLMVFDEFLFIVYRRFRRWCLTSQSTMMFTAGPKCNEMHRFFSASIFTSRNGNSHNSYFIFVIPELPRKPEASDKILTRCVISCHRSWVVIQAVSDELPLIGSIQLNVSPLPKYPNKADVSIQCGILEPSCALPFAFWQEFP